MAGRDFIGYAELTDRALRGVVRDVLLIVAKKGLLGSHHFYIAFDTRHPGVRISDALREQYPFEMAIVLQHQFWDLQVTEHDFEVTLSFNKIPETIRVPFLAIRGFRDPSVEFGFQFQSPPPHPGTAIATKSETPLPAPIEEEEKVAEVPREEPGQVVSLDAFRKK
ncbi:MAG: hypothetical protein GC190_04075 [Alphaproteobacteria bacterium]|nr:hypothetical protein [Alphaproteobacteria bacterium]